MTQIELQKVLHKPGIIQFFYLQNIVFRGIFQLPKTFRNLNGKVNWVKNVFYLTQGQFVYAVVTKIQDGCTDIAVNSLELVIPCENL